MSEIGLYMLKELSYNTSVRHIIPVHFWNQIMFHVRRSFIIILSDKRKQDATTTYERIKFIIKMFQKRTVFFSNMSTILVNKYGCVEQYRCANALYLLLILAHAYNIKIDRGVGAPGNVR